MGRSGCYFRFFCSTLGVRCWMFGVRILFERGVRVSVHGENWRSPTWHGRRQEEILNFEFWILNWKMAACGGRQSTLAGSLLAFSSPMPITNVPFISKNRHF